MVNGSSPPLTINSLIGATVSQWSIKCICVCPCVCVHVLSMYYLLCAKCIMIDICSAVFTGEPDNNLYIILKHLIS